MSRELSGLLADSLDVSSSTFHQHLRAAEHKLLDAILSCPRGFPSHGNC